MSLYDKLGISKESSKDEIKKAFRKLAVEHHPDKGGNEEKFKDISHAYEILSDDDKRKRYDLTGSENEQPQFQQAGGFNFHFGGGNPFDFMFNQAFGGNPFGGVQREEPIRKLDDTIHNIDITLKDAYFGITKNLIITTQRKCECSNICDKCKGECKLKAMRQIGPIRQMFDIQCDGCQGKGTIIKGCENCKGSGKIKEKETINLVIPKGVISGVEKRITGKGQQPFKKSEIAGDLVFKINVLNNDIFQRRNNDLIYKYNISFIDSICGKDLKIELFDEELNLNISSFGIVKEGVEYIVKDKGISGGNLIIIFNVEYPDIKLTEEQRNKIRELLG